MAGVPPEPQPGATGRDPRHPSGRPRAAERRGRKPAWLKQRPPAPRQYRATGALLDELGLHTVCEEARCPNKGECFGSGTATFLILGGVCTRACRFCSVEHATGGEMPGEASASEAAGVRGGRGLDEDEPARVAEAAARLGLRHVVVTSVTRDDLPDGGALHFAATVAAVRGRLPDATVEVLIPDLGGDQAALRAVLAAHPDVIGHNLETVPRLYPQVRPQGVYTRSLELLRRAAAWARAEAPHGDDARGAVPAAAQSGPCSTPGVPGGVRPLAKTGIMVGLGETGEEVDAVLRDAAAAGVDLFTIGQYLQPRRQCLPVARFVDPSEFVGWQRRGAELGLAVTAAPFVRSSYRAGEALHGQSPGTGVGPA